MECYETWSWETSFPSVVLRVLQYSLHFFVKIRNSTIRHRILLSDTKYELVVRSEKCKCFVLFLDSFNYLHSCLKTAQCFDFGHTAGLLVIC